MRSPLRNRTRWGLVPALLAALLVISVPASDAQVASGDSGVMCTTNPSASFTLGTASGTIGMPDGNSFFAWSFTLGSGAFRMPGPTLCVNEGDSVTVVLNNSLPEDVSIIFPGQTNVYANGVPAQPQFDSNNVDVTSLVQPAPKTGGSVTYTFVANQPGTYLYQSGTDPGKQVQMGLYGALIVRPKGHPDWAYDRADTAFNPATEYVMQFAELDPDLHKAIERGLPYDVTAFHPRYWLLNGRSFPDTIAPNNASWLGAQPQGSLVHIHPRDVDNPLPALVRYLNVGDRNHPFHPHGMHGRVIARDGSLLQGPAGEDMSFEKFLILIGSGQTWDATYNFTDIEGWNPSSNPIPVALPQQQNLTYKGNATWFSGSPYLGFQSNLPVGVTSYNQCGEYYQAWHSHALNEATNYDLGFGGHFTLERIDPPLKSQTTLTCS